MSPGNDGAVTQTIGSHSTAVAAAAVTSPAGGGTAATAAQQAAAEATAAAAAAASTADFPIPTVVTTPTLRPLVVAPAVPTNLVPPTVELPSIVELPSPELPEISFPAVPPLVISLPGDSLVVVTTIGATFVEAVQAAVGLAPPDAVAQAAAPRRPRAGPARVRERVQQLGVAGASLSRSLVAPPRRAVEAAKAPAPAAPSEAPAPRGPRPNAPAAAGAQLSSSTAGLLAAFAALLTAYLLFPHLTAWRVRVARDRRRLRPRASRFDPPG